MVRAIEAGYPQREIQRTAYDQQLEVEKRRQRVVVGVNAFESSERAAGAEGAGVIPVFCIDPQVEALQVERLRALRGRRDLGRLQRRDREGGTRGARHGRTSCRWCSTPS